jgi:drug/metabolite transporter (DMT)-like permease
MAGRNASWARAAWRWALYLSPLYAAVGAWLVLSEPLGAHHLLGAALILPGVLLVARAK